MWGRQYYRIITEIYSLSDNNRVIDYITHGKYSNFYRIGKVDRNLVNEYNYCILQSFSVMNDSKVYLQRALFSSLIQYDNLLNIINVMKNINNVEGYKKIYFMTEEIVQEYFSGKHEIVKRVTPFYIPGEKEFRWDLIEGVTEVLQLRKNKFSNTTHESKPEVEHD